MIKITRKNGDVEYLNENAFTRIKYCKDTNMLVAYPLVNSISKVTIEGILRIEDNVEIKEIQVEAPKEDFYTHPIEEVLDHIKASDYVCTRIRNIFCDINITTVGDLIKLKKIGIMRQRNVGRAIIVALSDALEELYGITIW
jgi:DNA-directed RNA polymerase alpha subunit